MTPYKPPVAKTPIVEKPIIPKLILKPIPPQPKPIMPNVSLKSLTKDNQRKPDPKHVSDLRDALKNVIGSEPKKSAPEPKPAPGPRPEDLKNILNGS